jgi:hypothetical protein
MYLHRFWWDAFHMWLLRLRRQPRDAARGALEGRPGPKHGHVGRMPQQGVREAPGGCYGSDPGEEYSADLWPMPDELLDGDGGGNRNSSR